MRPMIIALVLVLCLSTLPAMAADAPDRSDASWLSSLTELVESFWSSLGWGDDAAPPSGVLEVETVTSEDPATPTDSTVKEPGQNAGGWADPLG